MNPAILPLSEAITLQRGFDLPSDRREAGPYPVITSSGVIHGYHSKAMVQGPGVVLGRSGAIGGGQYIETDFWPLNTTLWVKDFKGNNEKYIYYLLRSIDFSSFNAGSGVPTLNRNHLSALKVTIPTRNVQDKIANMLGAIDEQIGLNRRMNETLERMGQALFKHYFIDNPEAKTWPLKALDDIADFLNGIAMQKYPKDGGDTLPVIKIREMSNGITDSTDIASAGIPERYIVDDGDILFSWSGTLIVKPWCDGRGALNQHLFKVTSVDFPKWFFYYWTKYHLQSFIETAAGKATTMGHIQRRHLTNAMVSIPPPGVLKETSDQIGPLLDKQIIDEVENRRLVLIRDSLLPRLISGRIEV